jgi:hypothetical protein
MAPRRSANRNRSRRTRPRLAVFFANIGMRGRVTSIISCLAELILLSTTTTAMTVRSYPVAIMATDLIQPDAIPSSVGAKSL